MSFDSFAEAMKEALRFAKEDLHIKEVVGRCARINSASANILEKLGFAYVRDIPYECNDGKNLYEGMEYVLIL